MSSLPVGFSSFVAHGRGPAHSAGLVARPVQAVDRGTQQNRKSPEPAVAGAVARGARQTRPRTWRGGCFTRLRGAARQCQAVGERGAAADGGRRRVAQSATCRREDGSLGPKGPERGTVAVKGGCKSPVEHVRRTPQAFSRHYSEWAPSPRSSSADRRALGAHVH